MNNLDKNSEKRLVLEDLLKIKRHERPDEAFWDKFDQQLHERTLKKLVYKPSLFSRLSHLFTISMKPALSVAALALFAFAIQPSFYSRTASVMVHNAPSTHQVDTLADLASTKKNYVKNNIVIESTSDYHYANDLISPISSSNGVRYLAGNLASVNLGSTIIGNTVY